MHLSWYRTRMAKHKHWNSSPHLPKQTDQMCCSLPCARNARTFLSLLVPERKKKHILIKSPTTEYVKKGVGQQAEKTAVRQSKPESSSWELYWSGNSPGWGVHTGRFQQAKWKPQQRFQSCLRYLRTWSMQSQTDSDFQVYQALCKACLLWNCIHKNPRKTQASIHAMISVMVQRLDTAPARLP